MKKAIQFGAEVDGIYRWTVKQSRISCVFADVNQKIIDKINEDKKYTIFVKDVESSDRDHRYQRVNSTKRTDR